MVKRVILIGVLLLAVGLAVWRLWPTGPRSQLMKQLRGIEYQLSKSPDEGAVAMGVKVTGFEGQFAPSCAIDVGPFSGDMSPGELSSLALRVRKSLTSCELSFSAVDLRIVDADHAYADFTATLQSVEGGQSTTDAREIHVEWKRLDDGWKITALRQVETLQR